MAKNFSLFLSQIRVLDMVIRLRVERFEMFKCPTRFQMFYSITQNSCKYL